MGQNQAAVAVNRPASSLGCPGPIRADDRIRARFVVRSAKRVPGALEAVFEVSIEVEGSAKPCCVAEWVLRYYF